jgi:LL-diaminopimelate aminotransferase
MKINTHYQELAQSYLFSRIAQEVSAYQKENPDKKIIRLGIGDVTQPLCPVVIDALHAAVDEMAQKHSFRGYGPEQGYDFLRDAVADYYRTLGVSVLRDEIFISDGAKSDLGNILDLFDVDNAVLVPDPVYPVYVDTNVMAGRKISYMNANAQNGFLPMPDQGVHADIIYLCSPNNPTGAAYGVKELKAWVDYARAHKAVILYDAAYESFIGDYDYAHSILAVGGARECAIEFCSFSKTAGFTGLRCGYTIVPHELGLLNKMWLRRQTTKFNGVAYIVQRAAAAALSPEGVRQTREVLKIYQNNAKVMMDVLASRGVFFTGGKVSPYVWMQCPHNMKSWDFFAHLLNSVQVVGTPGAGFGQNGEGFFRLTAFGDPEQTVEAMERIKTIL